MWGAPDITSTAISTSGLLVSIAGLFAVFIQVRRARGAAEAASRSARATREAVMQRVTEADLGAMVSEMRALQDRLRADQREAALRSCQEIRQGFAALRARPMTEISQKRQELLTGAMAALRRIREALEDPLAPTESVLDIASTNSEIENMIDFVVEWQENSLFSETEAERHE